MAISRSQINEFFLIYKRIKLIIWKFSKIFLKNKINWDLINNKIFIIIIEFN